VRSPSRPRARTLSIWALLAAAALPAAAAAAEAPSGWKVIKDRKGNCQMVVPGDWKGTASTASPEDRQAMAAIHLLPGKDWTESKAMAERFMVPQEVIENGPERFWIVYALRAARNPADAADDKAGTTPKGTPRSAVAPAAPSADTSATAPGAAKPSEVGWYVSVPGPLGPCAAQITFKTAELAETARQIALSVAAVVPVR
jgi:hypothetical protein